MCTGTSQTDIQSYTRFEERRKEGREQGRDKWRDRDRERNERKRNKERQARFSIPCRCFLKQFSHEFVYN